jgi:beta-glucosidase
MVPTSGEGNGFTTRFAEDFGLFAELGLTNHRLSIEWARVEPEEGAYDQAAIAHYRDMLSAARAAGLTPWVCLHHFTLPAWFAATGGFLVERNRTEQWARHTEFIAETFGDLVGGWQPVNETNYYAAAAYRGRGWPPGHNDQDEWAVATEAIQLASAEAAVRLKQTGVPVSSIFGLSCEVALDDQAETQAKVGQLRAVNWSAGLGLFRDGVLRVPGRDPVERPDLAGSFDLFGFSYYGTIGVAAGREVPYPTDQPRSPLGYAIWAEGLDLVLARLAEEIPGTPLLVAEFGIGTDDDAARAQYLRDGLAVVNGALARGIDIRGFFHWTGVDNYEWRHGFDVSFGLIDRQRVVRPSAQVLATEALP